MKISFFKKKDTKDTKDKKDKKVKEKEKEKDKEKIGKPEKKETKKEVKSARKASEKEKSAEELTKEVETGNEAPKRMKKTVILAPLVLKSPHISEKAVSLSQIGQYVFKVLPGANKQKIKRAIEEIYKVDVLSVRIVKIPRKKRRLGRTTGWKRGYKKAIVRIKEGQEIEILPR